MKFTEIKLATLILCLWCSSIAEAQDIWPGDINNNGVVNGIDALYIGLSFGTTGPIRSGGNANWEAQPLQTPWPQNFPDGINFAFADCDGNGTIDEDDLEDAIGENFGLTHGVVTPDIYDNGAPGTAPALRLEASTLAAFPGESFTIDVFLGDDNFPVGNFYGISFTLSFDQEFLADDDGIEFEFAEGSWIDPTGDDNTETIFKETGTGVGEVTIVRNDLQPVSGMGRIGTFSIIMEDIIVGLELDTFNINIENVKMIDLDLNSFSVVPGNTFVLVAQDSSFLTNTAESLPSSLVRIYPNPVQHQLWIESEIDIEELKLVNSIGQQLFSIPGNLNNASLSLPTHIPDGVYYLLLYCKEGVINKKIVIQSG